jgi:hypothetical protein
MSHSTASINNNGQTTDKSSHTKARSSSATLGKEKPKLKKEKHFVNTSANTVLPGGRRVAQSSITPITTLPSTPETRKAVVAWQTAIRKYNAVKELEKRKAFHPYRTNIVKEILDTETKYVGTLQRLVEEFLTPLRAASLNEQTAIISTQQVKNLFPNIEIIYNVNKQFLLDLQERVNNWSIQQRVGDIFFSMTGFLRTYTLYVENYSIVTLTVDECMKLESFRKFIKDSFGVPDPLLLTSLLITPIQRIPRYQLLLEQMKKKTWPQHRDYEQICRSHEKMMETAEYVNEKAKEAENIAKVMEIERNLVGKFSSLISPQRKFVRQGVLQEVIKNQLHERLFILFNDILVRAKRAKEKKERRESVNQPQAPQPVRWEFLEKVPLREIDVTNLSDEGDKKNSFEIVHPQIQYWIVCGTPEEKDQFMKDIRTHSDECKAKAKFYDEEKMRVAKDRANQAKALIGKQYMSLKTGGPQPLKPGASLTSSGPDSGASFARNSSFDDDSSSSEKQSSSMGKSDSLRKYKTTQIYRNMSPTERYQESKTAIEEIDRYKQLEKEKEVQQVEKASKSKEALEKKFGSLKTGHFKDYRALKAEISANKRQSSEVKDGHP